MNFPENDGWPTEARSRTVPLPGSTTTATFTTLPGSQAWTFSTSVSSGSYLCEPEMAAYLAGREDYQIATLEVGVNMRGAVSPQDFRERVGRLLDGVCRPEAGRKVFLVTVYPNISLPELDEAQRAFSTILHELHGSGRWPGLGLIEGGSVLDDPGDLTTDLIHPSDYGHARMGQFLGAQLRSALA